MNLGQLRSACYTQQFQPPQESFLGPREDIIEVAIVNREQLDITEATSRPRQRAIAVPSSTNAGTMGPPPPRRRKRASTATSETDTGQDTGSNATRNAPSTPKRSRTQRQSPPLDGALLHAAAQ